jgi:hypothetical protein
MKTGSADMKTIGAALILLAAGYQFDARLAL